MKVEVAVLGSVPNKPTVSECGRKATDMRLQQLTMIRSGKMLSGTEDVRSASTHAILTQFTTLKTQTELIMNYNRAIGNSRQRPHSKPPRSPAPLGR